MPLRNVTATVTKSSSGRRPSGGAREAGAEAPGSPSAGLEKRWSSAWAAAALALTAQAGCARDAELERQIHQLAGSLRELEVAGARRCAPRELAIAQSRLSFAQLDREQGQTRTARDHIARARENVQAARVLLAVSERCSDGPADAGVPPPN